MKEWKKERDSSDEEKRGGEEGGVEIKKMEPTER